MATTLEQIIAHNRSTGSRHTLPEVQAQYGHTYLPEIYEGPGGTFLVRSELRNARLEPFPNGETRYTVMQYAEKGDNVETFDGMLAESVVWWSHATCDFSSTCQHVRSKRLAQDIARHLAEHGID